MKTGNGLRVTAFFGNGGTLQFTVVPNFHDTLLGSCTHISLLAIEPAGSSGYNFYRLSIGHISNLDWFDRSSSG
jgi:hypothetical protein